MERTLVKSPPELWAELSDIALLGRLLEAPCGEIVITRSRPEQSLAWVGTRTSGTVELATAGWGTRVRLTAQVDDFGARRQLMGALVGVLNEVGAAHHRPFSRP